jgi:hypothetical protein
MVSETMDAAAIVGAVDTSGIQELSAGEYAKTVAERLPRDFVRMYHPDGTSSVVQLPPLGKNGKGQGDRQRKILHYMTNKLVRGKQWWYPSPPPGWTPKTPRYSCFLPGCERNREPNILTLFDLYQHFNHKHQDESKMFEGVLAAIQKKLSAEIPPELAEQLGLDVKTKNLDETQFAQVMMGQHLVPPDAAVEMLAEDAATELTRHDCPDCGWVNENNTAAGLGMHQARWCKKAEVSV